MIDGELVQDQQRDQQQSGLLEQAIEAHTQSLLLNLHTCIPGIIDSWDPIKNTVRVQPTIRRVFIEQGSVNLPLCVDAPVIFTGGGGATLTFPIKRGDECLICFSERAIDTWFQSGGVQDPFEYRMHDLSDGFVFVGLKSQPNNLIDISVTDVELRLNDNSVKIALNSLGITLKAPAIIVEGNLLVNGTPVGPPAPPV